MRTILLILTGLLLYGCENPTMSRETVEPGGKLFIIGGGKRPVAMIDRLIAESGLEKEGHYAVILPFASAEPDTAAYYGVKQFTDRQIEMNKFMVFPPVKTGVRDSLIIKGIKEAALIYITGGDQRRFMRFAEETGVKPAIQEAYKNGATIAGTSAGAAIMGELMITGDEFKHPEYTGDFRTIEADNLEVVEGLGLLPDAIVDQHFIYRMRMNRLITASIEHPGKRCIGIDESTAFLVDGDSAEVVGDWQVILLENENNEKVNSGNGLLGARDMELSVLLPGEKILWDKK